MILDLLLFKLNSLLNYFLGLRVSMIKILSCKGEKKIIFVKLKTVWASLCYLELYFN